METSSVIALFAALAIPIAALLTFFLNRRRNIADVYVAMAEGSHSAVDSMQKSLNAMEARFEEAERSLSELVKENAKMSYELSQLRQQNMLLLQENHALHRKIDEVRVTTGEISAQQSPPHDN